MTVMAGDRADELFRELGFERWRPGQREAVSAALEGRDSLIVMPTGGGKSLCYQLPGLASEDLTIVVSPLIALMRDQWLRLTAGRAPGGDDLLGDGRRRRLRRRSSRSATARRGSSTARPSASPRRVFLDAIATAADRPAGGRRGALRLRVGPRLPPRLPAPAADRRAARPADGDGLHGDRDECRSRPRSPPRFEMREPLQVRAGFDRPNLSFDVVALEGKGSKARRQALLEAGLADPANRPAIVYCGTRTRHRRGRRGAARTRPARARLPRRDGGGGSARAAQRRFMARRGGRGGRRHQRLRHGRRQGRRALGLAHGDPDQRRGLLPGGGARRGATALPAQAVLLAMQLRPRPAGPLQRTAGRRPRAGDRPRARLARLPGDQSVHLLGALPPAQRCSTTSATARPDAPLEPLLRRLRPAGLAARPGDDRGPPPRRAPTRRRRRRPTSPRRRPALRALKEWRLRAAAGKPAFTVAHNTTLEAIAATRPAGPEALLAIRGVGPGFVTKYADEVLTIVAERAAA